MTTTRPATGYDAIVVAGGSGRRLGGVAPGDQAHIHLAGRLLVDHVLAAVADARTVVCVASGLPDALLGDPVRCAEHPVGTGPLAAVAAGLERVTADRVALVAGDTPFVGDALATMRRVLDTRDADAAVLVDADGRRHYLAAVWRTDALRSALDRLGVLAGRSMRSLYDLPDLDVVAVLDVDDAAFDVDTAEDLVAAERRLDYPR